MGLEGVGTGVEGHLQKQQQRVRASTIFVVGKWFRYVILVGWNTLTVKRPQRMGLADLSRRSLQHGAASRELAEVGATAMWRQSQYLLKLVLTLRTTGFAGAASRRLACLGAAPRHRAAAMQRRQGTAAKAPSPGSLGVAWRATRALPAVRPPPRTRDARRHRRGRRRGARRGAAAGRVFSEPRRRRCRRRRRERFRGRGFRGRGFRGRGFRGRGFR